jgi:L-iditol 2-dehydrogenase
MKALVKTAVGPGNMEIRQVPEPKVGFRDVMIKVEGAGICGSDVLIWQDRMPLYVPPLILGHNVSGVVTEVGSEVRGLPLGTRVIIDLNVGACGRCPACRSKREYLCLSRTIIGFTIDGGMAEYMSVPQPWVVPIPDNVDMYHAAAVDVCNAIHTVVDRSPIGYGTSTVILGPGFQGLTILQVAKLLGASPIVMVGRERHKERLALAKELGADYAVASDLEDLPKLVSELTGGQGVESVIETTGVEAGLGQAVEIVKKGGCITLLGSLPTGTSLDMHKVVYDEISLLGVRGYNRENIEFFLSAMKSGKIDVSSFVGTFPLENWQEAFEARVNRKVIQPVLVP